MRHDEPLFQFTALPSDLGRALHAVLRSRYGVSRTLLRRVRTEGSVWVDGQQASLSDSPLPGQHVEVFMPFEPTRVQAEPLPLSVVYEDGHILVAKKPAGVLVHPTDMEPTRSLAASVAYHLELAGEIPFVGPVTRLDKETSGLVLLAKEPHAHYRLSRSMEAGQVHRAYLALVHGWLDRSIGTIDVPIRRVAGELSRREVGEGGQRAVTHYEVLGRYVSVDQRHGHSRVSLVRLRLETGRTHQIRVHMAYLVHPLLGDRMYGGGPDRQLAAVGMERQALHASELSLLHPSDGTPLEFTSPLPNDMQHLIASMQQVDAE